MFIICVKRTLALSVMETSSPFNDAKTISPAKPLNSFDRPSDDKTPPFSACGARRANACCNSGCSLPTNFCKRAMSSFKGALRFNESRNCENAISNAAAFISLLETPCSVSPSALCGASCASASLSSSALTCPSIASTILDNSETAAFNCSWPAAVTSRPRIRAVRSFIA